MAESFGAMTRRLRIEAAMSMNAMARRAFVDPAYVLRIERGVHAPSRTVVLKIAQALDLSPRQTDRYLFAAGFAPMVDWQTRAEDYSFRLATVYEAVDGMTLPDAAEAHPFVRRAS